MLALGILLASSDVRQRLADYRAPGGQSVDWQLAQRIAEDEDDCHEFVDLKLNCSGAAAATKRIMRAFVRRELEYRQRQATFTASRYISFDPEAAGASLATAQKLGNLLASLESD